MTVDQRERILRRMLRIVRGDHDAKTEHIGLDRLSANTSGDLGYADLARDAVNAELDHQPVMVITAAKWEAAKWEALKQATGPPRNSHCT